MGRTASPDINVTPLIDVLLVLLIIFMVITPLKPSRFKTLVPQPPDDARRIEPNPLTLVVTIEKDLRLKLNKEDGHVGSVNDTGRLAARLAKTFQERKEQQTYRHALIDQANSSEDDRVEKTVFIKAPRSITYGHVAKVIDGVKGAVGSPIGLQIDDLAQ